MAQKMGTECAVVKEIIETALANAPSVSKHYVTEIIRNKISPGVLLTYALKVLGEDDTDENGERIERNGVQNMIVGATQVLKEGMRDLHRHFVMSKDGMISWHKNSPLQPPRCDHVGIAHDGPMTSFSLMHDIDRRSWNLCREDLAKIANGIFLFTDGRPPIELEKGEEETVKRLAQKLLREIALSMSWPDIGEGFAAEFERHPGKFGTLTEADVGRKFSHNGEPHVFLGAAPRVSKRHPDCPLIAESLLDASLVRLSVEEVEKALGKANNNEWTQGF
jgi:hypothetical protein